METKTQAPRPEWLKLFEGILTDPGQLAAHYSAFHKYSLGNQVLAMQQLAMRGIEISPICSFNGWKEKGRKVKKGEKAIGLWMPITLKGKAEGEKSDSKEGGAARFMFVMRNFWFAHSQTEVDPRSDVVQSETHLPAVIWDKTKAHEALGVTEQSFDSVNGNAQGYAFAQAKVYAVSPIAAMPHKTRFHELAHCILHGNEDGIMVDSSDLLKCIKEAEAESTALLCCAALGLPGLYEARGYVQGWLSDPAARELFKKSAGRVFSAADKILKAGLVAQEVEVSNG